MGLAAAGMLGATAIAGMFGLAGQQSARSSANQQLDAQREQWEREQQYRKERDAEADRRYAEQRRIEAELRAKEEARYQERKASWEEAVERVNSAYDQDKKRTQESIDYWKGIADDPMTSSGWSNFAEQLQDSYATAKKQIRTASAQRGGLKGGAIQSADREATLSRTELAGKARQAITKAALETATNIKMPNAPYNPWTDSPNLPVYTPVAQPNSTPVSMPVITIPGAGQNAFAGVGSGLGSMFARYFQQQADRMNFMNAIATGTGGVGVGASGTGYYQPTGNAFFGVTG